MMNLDRNVSTSLKNETMIFIYFTNNLWEKTVKKKNTENIRRKTRLKIFLTRPNYVSGKRSYSLNLYKLLSTF